ncbi:hypothetical protein NAC44_15465 [Allorhizobium sp. BGMRC 0089]|uniref:hypothetical protein n=1 Tax=Allorhizobium sonneratiae TaxID=2934936 RepID=UPI0020332322|nr:hypothetical protein [Allorhizobium sonneratiae]MCM2293727.1 hypothetical protein [Allorhizobium sonneratiae]
MSLSFLAKSSAFYMALVMTAAFIHLMASIATHEPREMSASRTNGATLSMNE